MSTSRPDGAWVLFHIMNYKHCVPNGTDNGFLPPASCFLPTASFDFSRAVNAKSKHRSIGRDFHQGDNE
jgi:hypothetical protein